MLRSAESNGILTGSVKVCLLTLDRDGVRFIFIIIFLCYAIIMKLLLDNFQYNTLVYILV